MENSVGMNCLQQLLQFADSIGDLRSQATGTLNISGTLTAAVETLDPGKRATIKSSDIKLRPLKHLTNSCIENLDPQLASFNACYKELRSENNANRVMTTQGQGEVNCLTSIENTVDVNKDQKINELATKVKALRKENAALKEKLKASSNTREQTSLKLEEEKARSSSLVAKQETMRQRIITLEQELNDSAMRNAALSRQLQRAFDKYFELKRSMQQQLPTPGV